MTPKALVIAIASILIACSTAVIAVYIANLGFVKLGSQSVRFALTCALCVSLIRGWTPGRWITVVLMSLGGIGSIIGGVNLVASGHSGIGLLVLGLIYSTCVIALLTPFAGRHFNRKTTAEQGDGGQAATRH